MLKKIALLAGGLLFAATTATQAQDASKPDEAQLHAEVRCLAVSLTVAGVDAGGAAQAAGLVTAFYWFGRVDSHVPPTELEDRLLAEFLDLAKPGVFQSEATRCSDEMKTRGEAMSVIGKDMQDKLGKVLDQQKDPPAP